MCVCMRTHACMRVCAFVISLNGFFLDLMEQVPSQGNRLHHSEAERFENGEKLRTLVQSIYEKQNIDMKYQIYAVFSSVYTCMVLCCPDIFI